MKRAAACGDSAGEALQKEAVEAEVHPHEPLRVSAHASFPPKLAVASVKALRVAHGVPGFPEFGVSLATCESGC